MNIHGLNHGYLQNLRSDVSRNTQLTFHNKTESLDASGTTNVAQTTGSSTVQSAGVFTVGNKLEDYTQSVAPDVADKMKSIINRLDKENQEYLLSSGMIENEDFLAVAAKLDDEQLGQLTQSLQKLDSPSFSFFAASASDSQQQLLNVLSNSNDSTRTLILEKAGELADKVSTEDSQGTYSSLGLVSDSDASNNLKNFVGAVSKTDSPIRFLEKLDEFDEYQQSQILSVTTLDQDLGERLMDTLIDKGQKVRDQFLSFASEVANTANPFELDKMTRSIKDGDTSRAMVPGAENHYFDVSKNTIDDLVTILEDYELDNNQLMQMGKELNNLDRTNQRAYLEITRNGLEELLKDEQGNIPADELKFALDQLSELRNNRDIRMDVFLSRHGEPKEHDERFHILKSTQQADEDMTTTLRKYLYGNFDKKEGPIRF